MKKRLQRIALIAVPLLLILAAAGFYVLNRPFLSGGGEDTLLEEEPASLKADAGEQPEEPDRPAEKKDIIRNFALIGIDSRRSGQIDYANSDTMIIASVNESTGGIRMVSIYRDTLMNIGKRRRAGETGTSEAESFAFDDRRTYPDLYIKRYLEEKEAEAEPEDVRYDKANAAYANGSIRQFQRMVRRNLDIAIDEFIVVDFTAVAKMINGIGGIDVWMTKQEIIHMNNYCMETSEVTGLDYEPIEPKEEAQYYHLNGVQAVSYARIRYTAGNDYKRTQRQRVVIEKLIAQAKKHSFLALKGLVFDVLPNCRTSLSLNEMLAYATNADHYSVDRTTGFPFLHIGRRIYTGGKSIDPIVAVTLEENVRELHRFLYDDTDYVPSESVVRTSEEIMELHGFKESDREEAERHSVIRNSGGEADVVK